MADDTVGDVEDVEQTTSAGIDEIEIIAFLVPAILILLALIFDYKSLAQIGVGTFSAFTSPVDSFFNGLGTLISSFFNGLGKMISNGLIIKITRFTAAAQRLEYNVPIPAGAI